MKRRSPAVLGLSLLLGLAALASASTAQAQPPPPPVYFIGGIAAEGGGLVDRSQGLMGGAGLHLGIHFFGVEIFGLSQGFIGSLVTGPHSGSAQGLLWNSAMFGFGVGVFHLAAGPSLDFAWGCEDQIGDARCYHGAPLIGIDGRAALVFGPFSVSIDVHPTFYRGGTVTGIVAGIGVEF